MMSMEGVSLRRMLTFVLILSSVATLVISTSIQLASNIGAQRELVENNRRLVTEDAGKTVDAFIDEKFSSLEEASWTIDLPKATREERMKVFGVLLGQKAPFRQLMLYDEGGKELALLSRFSRQSSIRFSPIAGRGTRFASDVFIDSMTSEPLIVISIGLFDEFDAFQGTLAAVVNLKFMWDIIETVDVGRTGSAYVVDKRGNLIACSDISRVLKRENVANIPLVSEFMTNLASPAHGHERFYRGLTGALVLGIYAPISNSDWAVMTEILLRTAYRPIFASILIALGITLTLALLSSLSGRYISMRLTTPLADLMETANRIAEGKRELSAVATGPREIASLALSFNSMTAQLQKTLGGLEQEVSTRTRQLKEALEFQKEIVTVSSTGIVVFDSAGRCILANESAAGMFETRADLLLSSNFHDTEAWKGLGLYDAALACIESRMERQIDVDIKREDGADAWLNCLFRTFDSDGKVHLLLTVNDMTERVRVEREILDLNRQLQDQTERLSATNRELEAFSYSISHDLRTPLRAIDGYSRILLEDLGPAMDEKGKSLCEVIRKNTHRMGQLIDDLLAFSRLSRTQIQYSEINMQLVVNSVWKELTSEEIREKVAFTVQALPNCVGDYSLIYQVWVNLLSNALKFTAKLERPSIEVGTMHGEGENPYYVRDNGVGFDMQYVGKLFGVFQRLHRESEFEGTGVGLAIVQRIVNRHGGRIWAEGEIDKGATFYFTVPSREKK